MQKYKKLNILQALEDYNVELCFNVGRLFA